jgi:hypothetical protein
MKATPYIITINNNDLCPMSVSKVDGTSMMSSNQNKELHVKHCTPTSKDPIKGQTTVVIAVMRGNPKLVTAATAVTSTIGRN